MSRRFNPVPGSGEVFTTPPSFSAGNYFGFDLGYDRNGIIGSYVPQYNGNIGGMAWKSAHDGQVRKYDFAYDAVNRLTGADFNQYTGNGFNKACGVDFSVSGLDYDANGNIGHMNQMGLVNNTVKWVDQLAYTYLPNSNRLAKVADAAPNNAVAKLGDFQDGANSGDDYGYDPNGNMASDANKNISAITYNHLNLPQQISVTGKGTISYTYDAAGNKLQKTTTEGSTTTNTTYMGGMVYQNDVLQFIGMGEGRIRPNTSLTGFIFDYYLKDHLGNTRMTITDDPTVPSPILDATSYYPFGLAMAGISSKASGVLENKLKYNKGSELQHQEFSDLSGLEWYDANARFYDQQLGIFHQIDQLADFANSTSPYTFAEDNPVLMNDPTGLTPDDGGDGDSKLEKKPKPKKPDPHLLPNVTVVPKNTLRGGAYNGQNFSNIKEENYSSWGYSGNLSKSIINKDLLNESIEVYNTLAKYYGIATSLSGGNALKVQSYKKYLQLLKTLKETTAVGSLLAIKGILAKMSADDFKKVVTAYSSLHERTPENPNRTLETGIFEIKVEYSINTGVVGASGYSAVTQYYDITTKKFLGETTEH